MERLSDPTRETVVYCNTLVNDGRHVCRFRAGHRGEHQPHCNVDSIWPPAPRSGDGDPTPESLAQRFHEAYERLAPSFGYATREASAKPWAEVPENNRRLMTAVCAEILASQRAARARAEQERDACLDLLRTGIAGGWDHGDLSRAEEIVERRASATTCVPCRRCGGTCCRHLEGCSERNTAHRAGQPEAVSP